MISVFGYSICKLFSFIFLADNASVIVVRPTLPTNMRSAKIILDALHKSGVIPVDKPTVEIADTHSNKISPNPIKLPSTVELRCCYC